MASLFTSPFIPAFNTLGGLAPGAKLYFFLTGTTTPATVYAEDTLTTPLAHPVVANSGGAFVSIYLDPDITYRVQLKTSTGGLIDDADPITLTSGSGGTSGGLTPSGGSDVTQTSAAITAAANQGTVSFNAGTFQYPSGVTVPGAKIVSFAGNGLDSVLQVSGGSPTLITFAGDNTFAVGFRQLANLTFDGNGADAVSFRAGTTGAKFGDTTASIVHGVVTDSYFYRLETGILQYSSQQTLVEKTLFYRNKVGQVYRTDDTNGGCTALTEFKTVYQYNKVGVVLDKQSAFALATTGTLTNSNINVTSVASTTGLVIGMKIEGPGIKSGTTVAGFTATTITLSQTTTATAAMAAVPLLIRNTVAPSSGLPLFRTDGPAFDNTLFQGNDTCGLAVYGFNNVHLKDVYFESNRGGAPVAQTVGSRTVPVYPIHMENSTLTASAAYFGEPTSGAWTINLTAGSTLRLDDSTCSASGRFIAGDLTSSVEFFGFFRDAFGRIDVPVARWPDTINIQGQFSAIGNPTQVRGNAVANAFTGTNPRIPQYNVDGGGATATIENTAIGGLARAYDFPAVLGAIGSNSISVTMGSGTITIGDICLVSVIIWADSYTRVSSAVTNGSYVTTDFPVTPIPQRLVLAFNANATNSGVSHYLYPTNADGPKIWVQNLMQVVVPAGGDVSAISTVLREGLFNDGTLDGALVGTAVYDPPSIAAGAQTTTTVTVNGAAIGDACTAGFTLDLQGMALTAYVSATNTVTCVFRNGTGGAIDLASGTLRVRVLK